MKVLFCATRLAGTDGVSLESAKMREVFEERGHRVEYCAGELDDPDAPGAHLVEAMHFRGARNEALQVRAFPGLREEGAADVHASDGAGDDAQLLRDITAYADELVAALGQVVALAAPDLIVVQNAWAIPMQLPLASALARVAADADVPVLSHNHDYWWERTRFAGSRVPSYIKTYFPYAGASGRVAHLSINSAAQAAAARYRDIPSRVLPNVMSFEREPPGIDDFNGDFRDVIGVAADRLLLLQPTRVVPRKGIELAIDFAAELRDLDPALVITHEAGDEGVGYLHELQAKAEARGVDLRYVAEHVADARGRRPDGSKIYSLWDAYPHADLVTYPSLYEGFGNALLEAMWFCCPVLVNRYSVYVDDIAPKGFSLIEIDGEVTHDAVRQARALLSDPARAAHAADHNYELCLEHYSYAALARVLAGALADLGLSL